jgi:hypothetical protein
MKRKRRTPCYGPSDPDDLFLAAEEPSSDFHPQDKRIHSTWEIENEKENRSSTVMSGKVLSGPDLVAKSCGFLAALPLKYRLFD